MPNSTPTQATRQKIVDNTLGTLRIENLTPSEGLKSGLQAYVNGQKSTSALLDEAKSKYVALRRR